ncbi:MAG TPA: O-antigen ligase family protein [Geminicoccaceae bacterium]|nr:O-antigen ligase family protein [Geminicoccaceae bacterium]
MAEIVNLDSATTLALGLLLSAPVLWVCWRLPTTVALVALASLAVRPEVFVGGPDGGTGWVVQHTLLVLALACNALRYGVRPVVSWPILALGAIFLLSLLLGDLHPHLTVGYMAVSLVILALPFAFTQVALAPGSRRRYALVIALTPLLSVAIEAALHVAGIRPLFDYGGGAYRLQGAAGIPADLALLAFAGFAVALHESTRPGRRYAGYLAALNLALVILSGTRMGILASAVLLVAYTLMSEALRKRWREHRGKVILGALPVLVALAVYWPNLEQRLVGGAGDPTVRMSGRDQIWAFYFEEFMFSPIFGRGIGAGFTAAASWMTLLLPTPHNEYLHILVIGGVVGFVIFMAALWLWYRQLLRLASPNDRPFLIALIPALGIYAFTENVLLLPSALGIYAGLGCLLTAPGLMSLGGAYGLPGRARGPVVRVVDDGEPVPAERPSP